MLADVWRFLVGRLLLLVLLVLRVLIGRGRRRRRRRMAVMDGWMRPDVLLLLLLLAVQTGPQGRRIRKA